MELYRVFELPLSPIPSLLWSQSLRTTVSSSGVKGLRCGCRQRRAPLPDPGEISLCKLIYHEFVLAFQGCSHAICSQDPLIRLFKLKAGIVDKSRLLIACRVRSVHAKSISSHSLLACFSNRPTCRVLRCRKSGVILQAPHT